jgi:uncharacterized protein
MARVIQSKQLATRASCNEKVATKLLATAVLQAVFSKVPHEVGQAMDFNECANPGGLRRPVWSALIAAIVLLSALTTFSARAAKVEPLEIVTKSGVQVFSVELATTEEEKTTGLMYRKELPEGKGMLFDFSPAQEVSMWMKNTYVSLDMIFIRPDGRILRIAEDTEPLSIKIISSRGAAKGVLEVVGGTARKYGIEPGDRVAHPLFNAR